MDERLEEIAKNIKQQAELTDNGLIHQVVLRQEDYIFLYEQAELREENKHLKECEKWLVKIREEAGSQEHPPGVLEYAIAEPEGIYDIVVYLISQNQRYKEALEEIRNEASSYMGNSAAHRLYDIADNALRGEST